MKRRSCGHDNKGVMHAAVGGLEGTVFDNDWGNGGITGAKGAPPFKKVELETLDGREQALLYGEFEEKAFRPMEETRRRGATRQAAERPLEREGARVEARRRQGGSRPRAAGGRDGRDSTAIEAESGSGGGRRGGRRRRQEEEEEAREARRRAATARPPPPLGGTSVSSYIILH